MYLQSDNIYNTCETTTAAKSNFFQTLRENSFDSTMEDQ